MNTVELNKLKIKLEGLRAEYLKKETDLIDGLTPEERQTVGVPLKNILHRDSFTANGQKYIIHESLAMTRFEKFEELEPEVAYGMAADNLFDNLLKVYDFLNEQRPADASVAVHNMLNGIKRNLEGREHPVLQICSLYIAREGENLATYDAKLNAEKIEDWRQEGIDYQNFFLLAFNLARGFTPIYEEVSANTLSEIVGKRRNQLKKKAKKNS